MAFVKPASLSYEEVFSRIDYDPSTGIFRWKVDVSKNVKAGSIAGTFKSSAKRKKTGEQLKYLYIKITHYEFTASRIAWLLTYKVWPDFNVLFADGNPTNLKIENLKEGKFKTIAEGPRGRRTYKMTTEAQRHYGLMRYYGIDLAKYQEMLLAQNGVCAICSKPETSVVNGKIKPLAVDHCHNSEKIRGLLCARCNQAIGLLNEDVNILSSAIEYLRTHNINDTN